MFSDRYTCPRCEAPLPRAGYCHVCGADPSAGESSGPAATAADRTMRTRSSAATMPGGESTESRGDLPPIYVSTRDYGLLAGLASRHRQSEHPVACFLAAELERAVVCRPEDILDDVVTMSSRVLFQIGAERDTAFRTLVYPHQYLPTGQYISVLSPLGAALLGLREGSRMPFADLQGMPFTVAVEKVAYQPEARARCES